MARRVHFVDMPDLRINETDLQVLRYVGHRAAGLCVAGVASIAVELDKSTGTVRRSVKALCDKGLLSVRLRFLSNGGQLENEYEITDAGKRVLAAAKHATFGVRRAAPPAGRTRVA